MKPNSLKAGFNKKKKPPHAENVSGSQNQKVTEKRTKRRGEEIETAEKKIKMSSPEKNQSRNGSLKLILPPMLPSLKSALQDIFCHCEEVVHPRSILVKLDPANYEKQLSALQELNFDGKKISIFEEKPTYNPLKVVVKLKSSDINLADLKRHYGALSIKQLKMSRRARPFFELAFRHESEAKKALKKKFVFRGREIYPVRYRLMNEGEGTTDVPKSEKEGLVAKKTNKKNKPSKKKAAASDMKEDENQKKEEHVDDGDK